MPDSAPTQQHAAENEPAGPQVRRFDPEIPHLAGVYNVWLGGKDSLAAGWKAAEEVASCRPQVVAGARTNRALLAHAEHYLAGKRGIRQITTVAALSTGHLVTRPPQLGASKHAPEHGERRNIAPLEPLRCRATGIAAPTHAKGVGTMHPAPANDSEKDEEIARLQASFPQFRIWRESTYRGPRYVACRLRPGTRPHTVITSDLGELRAELGTGGPA